MIYVIYAFAGLFIALSLAMLFTFHRERHFGILLLGLVYGISGLLAIMLAHWWPLAAGFVLAWMLRLLGLEPGRGLEGRDG